MKLNRWLIIALGAALSIGVAARADVVLDWNALMIDAIRSDNSGPTLSSRNLAILHTAIYDSVNSITRTHQPYLFLEDAHPVASVEAAAVGAAREVMRGLYQPFEARSEETYQIWLADQPRTAALTNGLEFGRTIALLSLEYRSGDGSSTEVPYIPSDLPGQWRRTPPFFRPPVTPQWRYVTPFSLPEIESFVPAPPPALTSAEYARDVNQVKALGGKTNTVRTAEQTQIAVFWSDFSYTSMPPGHWHLLAAVISRQMQSTLEENARLFALLSIAQADAAIVCWEAKFRYNTWRPVTAIQRADEDGNPDTEKDAAWDHLLASPPFPSYTSGHSTFSKASAEVLTAFYGTDAITFTVGADSLPGVFRTFHSLAACADEVGMSRIYGGIHYMHDNVRGKECGRKVGGFVNANLLLAHQDLPKATFERLDQGVPVVRVHGHLGLRNVLEVSSDLSQWLPISTNTAAIGGTAVRDTAGNHRGQSFYRVRELP